MHARVRSTFDSFQLRCQRNPAAVANLQCQIVVPRKQIKPFENLKMSCILHLEFSLKFKIINFRSQFFVFFIK